MACIMLTTAGQEPASQHHKMQKTAPTCNHTVNSLSALTASQGESLEVVVDELWWWWQEALWVKLLPALGV